MRAPTYECWGRRGGGIAGHKPPVPIRANSSNHHLPAAFFSTHPLRKELLVARTKASSLLQGMERKDKEIFAQGASIYKLGIARPDFPPKWKHTLEASTTAVLVYKSKHICHWNAFISGMIRIFFFSRQSHYWNRSLWTSKETSQRKPMLAACLHFSPRSYINTFPPPLLTIWKYFLKENQKLRWK